MASPEQDAEAVSACGYSMESIKWFLTVTQDWAPALTAEGVPCGVLCPSLAIRENVPSRRYVVQGDPVHGW